MVSVPLYTLQYDSFFYSNFPFQSNAMNGIDILKKMGLEEMITNPDFAEFVSWFKESVNEDNYLTEEEVVK